MCIRTMCCVDKYLFAGHYCLYSVVLTVVDILLYVVCLITYFCVIDTVL